MHDLRICWSGGVVFLGCCGRALSPAELTREVLRRHTRYVSVLAQWALDEMSIRVHVIQHLRGSVAVDTSCELGDVVGSLDELLIHRCV